MGIKATYSKVRSLRDVDLSGIADGDALVWSAGDGKFEPGAGGGGGSVPTFTGTITGDGETSTFNLDHNLGSLNVLVQLWTGASNRTLLGEVEATIVTPAVSGENKTRVVFNETPEIGAEYFVQVIALPS